MPEIKDCNVLLGRHLGVTGSAGEAAIPGEIATQLAISDLSKDSDFGSGFYSGLMRQTIGWDNSSLDDALDVLAEQLANVSKDLDREYDFRTDAEAAATADRAAIRTEFASPQLPVSDLFVGGAGAGDGYWSLQGTNRLSPGDQAVGWVGSNLDNALGVLGTDIGTIWASLDLEYDQRTAADAAATTDRAAIRSEFASPQLPVSDLLVGGAGAGSGYWSLQGTNRLSPGDQAVGWADSNLDNALGVLGTDVGTIWASLDLEYDQRTAADTALSGRIDAYDNRIDSSFNVEASAGTAELHFGQGQPRMVMTANSSGEVTVCFDVKPAE